MWSLIGPQCTLQILVCVPWRQNNRNVAKNTRIFHKKTNAATFAQGIVHKGHAGFQGSGSTRTEVHSLLFDDWTCYAQVEVTDLEQRMESDGLSNNKAYTTNALCQHMMPRKQLPRRQVQLVGIAQGEFRTGETQRWSENKENALISQHLCPGTQSGEYGAGWTVDLLAPNDGPRQNNCWWNFTPQTIRLHSRQAKLKTGSDRRWMRGTCTTCGRTSNTSSG